MSSGETLRIAEAEAFAARLLAAAGVPEAAARIAARHLASSDSSG